MECWYHYTEEGRGEPASYEELSTWERVLHGGPWMDVKALREYWKRMERLGIIPLVAELEGKVVGHLDVLFCEDPVLGRYLYLDVLMVHKEYRRRGVARALVFKAEELARERGVEKLVVQPESYEGPSGLTYRSCGFTRAYEVVDYEIRSRSKTIPGSVKLVSVAPSEPPPVKTHPLLCGWYVASAKMWDYATYPRDVYEVFQRHSITFKVDVEGEGYYVHLGENLMKLGAGYLCVWAPPNYGAESFRRVVEVASSIARTLNMTKVETRTLKPLSEILEEAGFRYGGRAEPFMVKEVG